MTNRVSSEYLVNKYRCSFFREMHMSLEAGFDALKQGRYQEAVRLLKQYCHCSDARAKTT
ncbi:hypothetical protein [Coleofasciculus sp. FACHB-129]|uniref:hypothetical protein n=1 Tax=Coleofasciculus sp. FACHB-129 TaxID=2692785 RepID=UPI001A7EF2EF|nr:hypothetical protein [Coleofasciculus sp. FACHB-129]